MTCINDTREPPQNRIVLNASSYTLLHRRPIPANAIMVKSVAATTLLKITNKIHNYILSKCFFKKKTGQNVLLIDTPKKEKRLFSGQPDLAYSCTFSATIL
jgi:hypothetical protein